MPTIGQIFAGEILHLPEVLKLHPDTRIVIYNRVSSYGQAHRRKKLLHAKTDAVVKAVKMHFPEIQVMGVFDGVEEGFLFVPRKTLNKAAVCAHDYRATLVAIDESRFIRPPSYSRTKNRNARPRRKRAPAPLGISPAPRHFGV